MSQKLISTHPLNHSTNSPLVSVIMNCLNGEKYLKEAINSVYAQTYPNWEIIFWDNASTDSSAEIARSYDERLRYFHGEETIFLYAARNRALEKAQGEFIAFLDCDDLWMPEKLEKQLLLFDNLKVGLVFCDVINFSSRGNLSRTYKYIKPPNGKVFRALLSSYFLTISSVIIRRSVLDAQEEWFDRRLQVSGDRDFFLRIAWNYDLEFVDEPLAKLRIHGDSDSHRKFELFAVENELILKKFVERYQNFEQDYASQIEEVRKNIAFQRAIGLWVNGRPRIARMVLKPYILQRKHFMFYIASYLPTRFFNTLFSLYKYFPKLSTYNN